VRTHIGEARELLEKPSPIVIITHTRPDGDAVASMLALLLSLTEGGRPASAVMQDPLPPRFSFLPGADQIQTHLPKTPHTLIAVDCGERKRISLPDEEIPEIVDLNIDHHRTNPCFGQINFVCPEAASTTQILYELLPELGLPITLEVASNLIAGLVTDTIGFRTENVTPSVLRMSAELLELGVPLAEIYEKALTQQTYESIRLWGRGLSRLNREGSIVWTSLRFDDRMAVGYPGNDDADLTNLLSAIQDVEVSIVFVEQENGAVKVSFRSRDNVDVAELATRFGGGGHAVAAGVMIEGNMDEVVESVLAATRQAVPATPERVQ
jgi:phosphoesterase RecJ-like protein